MKKLLLDENLDRRLRINLSPHEAFSVDFLGWKGVKNGRLLRAAEDHGFEVLVTGDQSLCDEQNLEGRRSRL